MDGHHIAHYAIAAALALGGGGALYHEAQTPRIAQVVNLGHVARATSDVWPALSEAQVAALTEGFRQLKLPKLTLYCQNIKCDDVADDFADAARAAGTEVIRDVSVVGVPKGFSVGAADPGLAGAIGDAMVKATGLIPRSPRESYKIPYVAFGERDQ